MITGSCAGLRVASPSRTLGSARGRAPLRTSGRSGVSVLIDVMGRRRLGSRLLMDADRDVRRVPDERRRRSDSAVQVRGGLKHQLPDRCQRVVVEALHEHAGR